LRYSEDFVLLAEGEIVLQSEIDRLIDIAVCYGMEKIWTRQTSVLQNLIEQRKMNNVEYFNRLGCLVQFLHVKLNHGFLWQNVLKRGHLGK